MKCVGILLLALMMPVAANATLLIDLGVSDPSIDSGLQTSQAQINAYLDANFPGIEELYKDNVGGSETGAAAAWYTTTYFNDPLDPKDADITWDNAPAGPFIDPTADTTYLLMKDGKQDPAWYLFDLSALGWDGKEDIQLRNFWPRQGAISHLSMYGVTGCEEECFEVPEPGPLGLLGVGLIALHIGRRRRSLS